MLDHIFIRNFKSIQEAQIDLQPVNLLIGPNNSGKSNFLEAFVFLREFILNDQFIQKKEFFDFYNKSSEKLPLSIKLYKNKNKAIYNYCLEIYPDLGSNLPIFQFQGISKNNKFLNSNDQSIEDIKNNYDKFQISSSRVLSTLISSILDNNEFKEFYRITGPEVNLIKDENNFKHPQLSFAGAFIRDSIDFRPFDKEIIDLCIKTKVYKINPEKIKNNYVLNTDKFVYDDASNLVSFLDNIRDIEPNIIEKINIDIRKCIPEFKELRFEKISLEEGRIGKRVGLIDKNKNIYWADELSEGTIYFLALLSIIHQPSPPSLLLLEEPEKGIHPRRIHEVIDYIFELSNNKNIQVIMTTHSPQVVDEFNDIPEAVHVFEMEDGITSIKNLQKDIIDEAHKKSREKKLPEINFSKSLGEHWSLGFLGGVPK